MINQYNIFYDQRSCPLGQGGRPLPPPTPLLWAPTSPITVLAIHNIASSVKCYGPRPRPFPYQPTTVLPVREILYPTGSVKYLIDGDYVISMPSVISYYISNISYMYNNHDHDTISFTCVYWLVNTIFLFSPWSWPPGQGACPLLWAPTSPITVLAIHNIASSVKCYGPRPLPLPYQPTTVLPVPRNIISDGM